MPEQKTRNHYHHHCLSVLVVDGLLDAAGAGTILEELLEHLGQNKTREGDYVVLPNYCGETTQSFP